MDLLLGLPNVLSTSVLVDWLGAMSLPRIESAYCHRKKRDALLATFSSVYFIAPPLRNVPGLFVHSAFLKWIHNRKIRVSELVVRINNDTLLIKYLELCGGDLATLTIDGSTCAEHYDFPYCAVLQVCPKLRRLVAVGCPITEAAVEAISQFPQLRELCLNCDKMHGNNSETTYDTKTSFPNLLQLTALQLSNNMDIGPFLYVTDFSAMRFLGVPWVRQHSQRLLEQIALCRNLEALHISAEKGTFSDAACQQLLSLCPHIQHLHLQCLDLSENHVRNLTQGLSLLKTISISANLYVNQLLEGIAEHNSENLEELCLQYFIGSLSPGLSSVLQKCIKLRRLYIQSIWDLQLDPTHLGNITTLAVKLGGLVDLGYFLRIVAPYCTNVTNLSMNCSEMNAEDFDVLAQVSDAFPALRFVKLSARGDDAARWLRAQRPHVKVQFDSDIQNDHFHSLYNAAREITFEDEF